MTRFVGIKNNHISIVSDKSFVTDDSIKVIELPKEFNHLSSEELIVNCRFSNR